MSINKKYFVLFLRKFTWILKNIVRVLHKKIRFHLLGQNMDFSLFRVVPNVSYFSLDLFRSKSKKWIQNRILFVAFAPNCSRVQFVFHAVAPSVVNTLTRKRRKKRAQSSVMRATSSTIWKTKNSIIYNLNVNDTVLVMKHYVSRHFLNNNFGHGHSTSRSYVLFSLRR